MNQNANGHCLVSSWHAKWTQCTTVVVKMK